ncbi:MAG: hypothetical protein AVDCRST_MAG23-2774 [uncultured Sphingosinicella sp.]|uniref:Uncharacterized protein n=1 Tax=uncultured Sphingosinicella sp. TaxID=478748 RepID=A0A6J4UGC1_9SPHN|nr:MAG: hypothetical protein AVDCRST_MAG23-2774 [uncultured Sphingosinicella sp.]
MISLNRTGCNRWVVLTRRYALKFPRPTSWRDFLVGLRNNLNEARDGNLSGRCPVIAKAPLGFAIVMPRARILTEIEFAGFDYHGFCREHKVQAEPKPDSFGVVAGRVVAVDYGW